MLCGLTAATILAYGQSSDQLSLNRVAGTKWLKLKDEEGDFYYYNEETEVTQWDTPADVFDAQAEAAAKAIGSQETNRLKQMNVSKPPLAKSKLASNIKKLRTARMLGGFTAGGKVVKAATTTGCVDLLHRPTGVPVRVIVTHQQVRRPPAG